MFAIRHRETGLWFGGISYYNGWRKGPRVFTNRGHLVLALKRLNYYSWEKERSFQEWKSGEHSIDNLPKNWELVTFKEQED